MCEVEQEKCKNLLNVTVLRERCHVPFIVRDEVISWANLMDENAL